MDYDKIKSSRTHALHWACLSAHQMVYAANAACPGIVESGFTPAQAAACAAYETMMRAAGVDRPWAGVWPTGAGWHCVGNGQLHAATIEEGPQVCVDRAGKVCGVRGGEGILKSNEGK